MNRIAALLRERHLGLIAILLFGSAILFPVAMQGTVAPAHKTDLLIKGRGGFKGDDVRNRSGGRQMVKVTKWPGKKAKIRVRVQNEGDVPDQFRMRGPGKNRDFVIRYFHGGKNFTGAFKRGNLTTPEVPLMDVLRPDFLLELRLGRKFRPGATRTIRIRGESIGAPVGDGTDVVKAKLMAP